MFKLKRLADVWRIANYNLGFAVLLFVLLNLASWIVLQVRYYNPCLLLDDFCGTLYSGAYGVAQFRIRLALLEYHGENLNIDAEGWRIDDSKGKLFDDYSVRNYNIFLFGGSTMFGFGVTDNKTIAAHLQGLMGNLQYQGKPVRVYNLGQPAYSSKDEVYLLVDQLKQGRVPDMVVFYDGINETCMSLDSGMYENLTVEKYEETDFRYFLFKSAFNYLNQPLRLTFENLSIYQVVVRLRAKLARGLLSIVSTSGGKKLTKEDETRRLQAHAVACSRVYMDNASLVVNLARLYGFKPLFILQPSGVFLPNAETYRFPIVAAPEDWRIDYYKYLYRSILEEAKRTKRLNVWDLSKTLNKPVAEGEKMFIEWQHLNDRGNQYIAVQLYAILTAHVSSGGEGGYSRK